MPRRLLAYSTPTQISGLVTWLKADALSLNDGDAVASWTDSSGNSNTPTQSVAGNKPTYIANGLFGKPVIRFDGSDWLSFPTESVFDLATPTIFVVAKRNSGTNGAIMGKSTTGFSNGQRRKLNINGTSYSSGSDSQGIGVASTATNWNLFGVVTTSDSVHSLFLNGTQTDFTTALGDSALNNATMMIGSNFSGGTEALNGDIAEIVIYNRPLGAREAVGLQNYLAAKYNLPTTLELGGTARAAVSGRVLIRSYGNCVRTDKNTGSSITWTNTPFLTPTVVTAGLWLRLLSNTSSVYDVPFGFGNTRWFFLFNSTTNKPGFVVKVGGVELSSGFISGALQLNRFYFLCGTYDPSGGSNNLTIRVYDQNAQLYGSSSSTQTGNMDTAYGPLCFGRDVVRAFNMSVDGDEIHVYSRVLTVNEQNGLAYGTEPSTSGLELWARCNETSGNLTDSSGNGRTGTNNVGCTFVPSLGGGARVYTGSGVAS